MPPSVGYVAYIDEAGDDGLARVRPSDPGAASEWLIISCLLVKAERDGEVLPWLKTLISSFDQHQMAHLHFRQLRDDQRSLAADYIASLPVRLFAIISNKQNMRGYKNPVAAQAKINVTAWFYVWLSRIMIERVTAYCQHRTIKDYGENRTVRFEFASRGGVKIDDVVRYLKYLKDQDEFGLMYNTFWKPSWNVMDFNQIRTYPAKERAGLQLSDCVASSFYAGLEFTAEETTKPQFAIALMPRMARSSREKIYGFGVKVWPEYAPTIIRPGQRPIFDYYLTK
jgi:hypothetical protein